MDTSIQQACSSSGGIEHDVVKGVSMFAKGVHVTEGAILADGDMENNRAIFIFIVANT